MFQHKVHNKGSSLGESVSSYGITGTLDEKTAGWSRAVLSASGTTLVDIKVEGTRWKVFR